MTDSTTQQDTAMHFHFFSFPELRMVGEVFNKITNVDGQ